ncbi:MAG: MBL fold metallo-hydrolase [Chloroflexales bacterium]
MPRMILLGTGTGVPDADRENTHMVWDGPGGPLLIDVGGSTYQRLLRAGIDPLGGPESAPLQGVLLTHSHCDHINGLTVLLFSLRLAGRTEPLPIYGLAPTLELVQRILDAFALDDVHPPIIWTELQAGDRIPLAEGWDVRTALTAHSRPCLALRVEHAASGLALAYSADTEPCSAVADLARGAVALIHEATTPEPFAGHTTPRQAGAVAAAAGVRRLTLVHYSPRWTMPEEQALADVRAGGYAGLAEIGREYQVIEL